MRSLTMLMWAVVLSSSTASEAAPLTEPVSVVGGAAVVDEDQLSAATTMLLNQVDAARVALVVSDDDEVRRVALERSLVRVVRDRRREDVVSPAMVRARLGALTQAQLADRVREPAGLAADHLLLVEVVANNGAAVAEVRLVVAATAAVVGTQQLPVAGAATTTTAHTADLQRAADDIAAACADAVAEQGLEVAGYQVAVPPATSTGAATTAKLDRHMAVAVTAALRHHGFLVVERRQLDAALAQLALAQLSDTNDAGALGKVLGAQGMVLVQIADDGPTFVVTARLVDVASSTVLSATTTTVEREGVVGLNDVETRTPLDSGLRSLVLPGWGQLENGEPGKAVLFAAAGFGALATTAGLGTAAWLRARAYDDVEATTNVSPAEAAEQAVSLRGQTNALLVATAIAGGVTAVTWAFNVADAFANGDGASQR